MKKEALIHKMVKHPHVVECYGTRSELIIIILWSPDFYVMRIALETFVRHLVLPSEQQLLQ